MEQYPLNLKDFMKSSFLDDFNLRYVFSLELKHGLMGYFPLYVVEENKNQILYTHEPDLVVKLSEFIEPKPFKINILKAAVSPDEKIFYCLNDNSPDESLEPFPIFGASSFQEEDFNTSKFKWKSGLIGGSNISREEFKKEVYDLLKDYL